MLYIIIEVDDLNRIIIPEELRKQTAIRSLAAVDLLPNNGAVRITESQKCCTVCQNTAVHALKDCNNIFCADCEWKKHSRKGKEQNDGVITRILDRNWSIVLPPSHLEIIGIVPDAHSSRKCLISLLQETDRDGFILKPIRQE